MQATALGGSLLDR